MKIIVIALIFSFKAFTCNYNTEIIQANGELTDALERVTGTCQMLSTEESTDRSQGACECAQEYKESFGIPTLSIPQVQKLKEASVKKLKLSFMDVANSLMVLQNHSKFENDTEIGQYCSIGALTPDCNTSPGLNSTEKSYRDQLRNQFENYVKNNVSTNNFKTPSIVDPPIQNSRNEATNNNSCGLTDRSIYRIGLQSTTLQFESLIRSLDLSNTSSSNLRDAVNSVDSDLINSESFQEFFRNLESSNPLLSEILKGEEYLNILRGSNFSTESIQNLINSELVKNNLKAKLINKCNAQKAQFKKIFCPTREDNSPLNLLPDNFQEFKSIQSQAGYKLFPQVPAHDYDYNRELVLYCENKNSPDKILSNIKNILPENLKAAKNLESAVQERYQASIVKQAELICNSLTPPPATAEPGENNETPSITERNNCTDSISADCMFIRTFEAMYSDEIAASGDNPELIFAGDTTHSTLISGYLGEEVTTSNTITTAETTPPPSGEQTSENRRSVGRTPAGSTGNGVAFGGSQSAGSRSGSPSFGSTGNTDGPSGNANADFNRSVTTTNSDEIQRNMQALREEIRNRITRNNQRGSQVGQTPRRTREDNLNELLSGRVLGSQNRSSSGSDSPQFTGNNSAPPTPLADIDFGEQYDVNPDLGGRNRALEERELARNGGSIENRNRAGAGNGRGPAGSGSGQPLADGPAGVNVSETSEGESIVEVDGDINTLFAEFGSRDYQIQEEELIRIIQDPSKRYFYIRDKNSNAIVKVSKIDTSVGIRFVAQNLENRSLNNTQESFRDSVETALNRHGNAEGLIKFFRGSPGAGLYGNLTDN